MKIRYAVFGLMLCLSVFTGCEPSPPVKVQTTDFAFVSTKSVSVKDYEDILNSWLRKNPDSKIVCIAGVLHYRDDLDGYLVYFTQGNNASQHIVRIDYSEGSEPYGFEMLQVWKDAHKAFKIISFTTIPKMSGGVNGVTVCYEDQ